MNTSEHRKKRKLKSLILAVLIFSVTVAALTVLFKVYVAKTITWDGVFSSVGLEFGVTSVEHDASEVAVSEMWQALEANESRITFLNVGQGDCAVIESGDMVVMIDAGDYFSVNAIEGFLRERKITDIDYLIATHPHTDHIGSMSAVIKDFNVENVLFTNVPRELMPTNDTFFTLLETLAEHADVSVNTAGKDERIELPSGTLTVLSAGNRSTLNDCSIVLRYDCGESSFLFMGDAEYSVERELVDQGSRLDADVLKVGHHGSKYSTSESFVKAVDPEFAVISCGAENQYGYPKESVLEILNGYGAEILRTDQSGTIVFVTDGRAIRLYTEQKEAA